MDATRPLASPARRRTLLAREPTSCFLRAFAALARATRRSLAPRRTRPTFRHPYDRERFLNDTLLERRL